MTDATAPNEESQTKRSKLPLIVGLVLALAGGGGGFFAVQSGALSGILGHGSAKDTAKPKMEALPDVAFVSIPVLTVSLPATSSASFLRFQADLEVPSRYAGDVESVMPRVVDVLNSYLRAIEPSDVTAPGALIRLRGQMLRRVQMVVGDGRVKNLLIIEFVLN